MRGPKPLTLAMLIVLALGAGAIVHNHVAWHVLAPFTCLAGVVGSCERRGFNHTLGVGFVVAAIIYFLNLPRLETGYMLACAHAAAFFYGLHVFKKRKKMTVHAARRVGVVVASCAAGVVGALLWAHGLSTTPAQCTDIVLFVVLIVLSAW